RRAVDAYEQVADSDERLAASAIYNRALAYRALGPHEWQERGYRAAPDLDVERRGLHYTFLGDYLARTNRWREAIDAYRRAARANPDGEAPRQGLLDAYVHGTAIS